MLPAEFDVRLRETLAQLHADGLNKDERWLHSPQGAEIEVEYPRGAAIRRVLNFCANDYLGLANHPEVVAAARSALHAAGSGMASVRFICGTHAQHRRLEEAMAAWLGQPDAILFPSCFDANAAVFEVLLEAEDVVIADRLIHASLIDGIRLSRARHDTFKNADLDHLRRKLETWRSKAQTLLVVTDGVFSMDGILAPVGELAALCADFDALLLVDDSHATGVYGPRGAGTPALFGAPVDIVATTLGKALGGASGGILAGPAPVVELLRSRARPYLFSNSVPPSVAAGALKAVELAQAGDDLRARLTASSALFRGLMEAAGFTLVPGGSAIVPVMLGDARLARDMAAALLDEGVYVVGFSHPVVPQGQARIRVQLSAAHTEEMVIQAAEAFTSVRAGMSIRD